MSTKQDLMDISVVVLSWNSRRHLGKCIPSLIKSLEFDGLQYEILVVDNGSTDGSVEFIGEMSKIHPWRIVPIYLTSNTGTTYSRNLALKQANGEYIVVLDSDVEVPEGVFQVLIDRLNSLTDTGLVAPRLLYPSGSLQKSTDQFPTITRKLFRFFFLKWIEKNEGKVQESGMKKVDYAISAFWLFPKKILDEVGYLDEKIFYAPEDVDYCLRIWKHNYKIIYDPSISAVHHAQEISRGFKINRATYEHIKGLVYYFCKHKYLFVKPKFD